MKNVRAFRPSGARLDKRLGARPCRLAPSKENHLVLLAEVVGTKRLDLNLTLQQLAAKTNGVWSWHSILKLEQGRRIQIHPGKLFVLCVALNLSMDEIFASTEFAGLEHKIVRQIRLGPTQRKFRHG